MLFLFVTDYIMVNRVVLAKSSRKNKKYMVIMKLDNGRIKTVHFGQKNYSDMTIHKNPDRKKNYISRHKKREDWTKSGITTAGFWSRWILWNKPTLKESIIDTEKMFDIEIIMKI